jgi:hypothetical protein
MHFSICDILYRCLVPVSGYVPKAAEPVVYHPHSISSALFTNALPEKLHSAINL